MLKKEGNLPLLLFEFEFEKKYVCKSLSLKINYSKSSDHFTVIMRLEYFFFILFTTQISFAFYLAISGYNLLSHL